MTDNVRLVPATTYDEVATACNLNADTATRFLRYMRGRKWGGTEARHCSTGYAAEWAARFAEGIEYQMSDEEGQALLDAMEEEKRWYAC